MFDYTWDELVADPEREFASPELLAVDGNLTPTQKIELLKAWERNAQQLLIAEGEGLIAELSGATAAAELLQTIRKALAALGAPPDGVHPSSGP